jgi:DNA-binding transcriptional ArsR family regulator
MNCHEHNDPTLGIEDWMIERIEKCAYSSINRERRAILEILADTDKPISASQIGASKGLGLEREGVSVYLAPLFAVGLIKRQVESKNNFKWFIEDEKVKNFIKQVSGSVPQIKLKEDEEIPVELIADETADEEFDNYGNKTKF